MFGNVITLQIIPRNEIPGNNDLFKVTSTENKVWLPGQKESSISKMNVACSNTKFI